MGKVQWADDLSIGVHLIDEQHKMLIQRLNAVHEAVQSYLGQAVIAGALQFLAEYADFHFSAEEKHMEETGYPGLPQQRVEHAGFRKTLVELERDFLEDGATQKLAVDIDTLLISWLIDHIHAVDLKFGRYLREKDITLS